ncbi:MAG: ABC-2 family transporter protein [Clostridiaceae bacterium]|nr:ABC-2 family transporter protein [Clostridiaceae bacterium]MBW4860661.1 ABC-2 family transporter protein [Clostridiaceae bacterium]MBW4868957.1 ABC-2 family transporter protein [Clostridiaceae bacterium]
MGNFRYYISIIITFIKFNIKKLSEYRVDFYLGVFLLLIIQFLNLSFFYLIFDAVPEIDGWNLYEILLVYGFYTLNCGFFIFLFGKLRSLKAYLYSGEFEIMLTRPIPPILHILISGFNEESIFEIILGFIIIFYAMNNLGISFNFINTIIIILFMILGSLIFGAIAIIAESILFYTRHSFTPIDSIFSLAEFTKYPISIFGIVFQKILTFIIPLGFLSYYPANYFLNKETIKVNIFFAEGVILCILIIVSKIFFNKGLKKYEGNGN